MNVYSLMCIPKKVAVTPSSQDSRRTASHLLLDPIGLVWRSTGTTGTFLRVQQVGLWDVFALLGGNTTADATIRIRAGATSAETDGSEAALDVTIPASAGAPKRNGVMTVHRLDAPVEHQWIRIDIIDADNPAGFIEASRLVIGLGVECDGIDNGAEVTYDNSTTSVYQRRRTTPTWKITLSGITKASWYETWENFLCDVGERVGFLFVPIMNGPYMSQEAALVSTSNTSKNTLVNWDYNQLEMTVQTII